MDYYNKCQVSEISLLSNLNKNRIFKLFFLVYVLKKIKYLNTYKN